MSKQRDRYRFETWRDGCRFRVTARVAEPKEKARFETTPGPGGAGRGVGGGRQSKRQDRPPGTGVTVARSPECPRPAQPKKHCSPAGRGVGPRHGSSVLVCVKVIEFPSQASLELPAYFKRVDSRRGLPDGFSPASVSTDTLEHLLGLVVTPAYEQDRAQVGQLAQAVQSVVEQPVQLAYADQGYTGEAPAEAAAQVGLRLEPAKPPARRRRRQSPRRHAASPHRSSAAQQSHPLPAPRWRHLLPPPRSPSIRQSRRPSPCPRLLNPLQLCLIPT